MRLISCYNDEDEEGKGVVGTALVGERAKIILDEVKNLSLYTREQCLQHIGKRMILLSVDTCGLHVIFFVKFLSSLNQANTFKQLWREWRREVIET